MRKILAVLTTLSAVAAMSGVASADVASTITNDVSSNQMDAGQSCTTPWQTGTSSAYGMYIDGCTARTTCPSYATNGCTVYGWGSISDYNGATDTMNARLRVFNYNGTVGAFWDTSCPGAAGGCTTPHLSSFLARNASASLQCNGVRRTYAFGYAYDRCHIEVFARMT